MNDMLKRLKKEPNPTTAGVVTGMLASFIAARFVQAAWDAAQREGARQTVNQSTSSKR